MGGEVEYMIDVDMSRTRVEQGRSPRGHGEHRVLRMSVQRSASVG